MNYYSKISNILAEQKHRLGKSEALLAHESGLSQPTVHRILSGEHKGAAWDDVVSLGQALGVEINIQVRPATEILDERAEMLAKAITSITQSTSQLEGQGVSDITQDALLKQTKTSLLAGPKRKLWFDE